jgi:hypothetical protein
MEPIMQEASRLLYQATAGRLYLGGYKVIVGTLTQPLERADFQVYSSDEVGLNSMHNFNPQSSRVVDLTTFTIPLIDLDKNWWRLPTKEAGRVLLHLLMHQIPSIRDEYTGARNIGLPVNDTIRDLCPISLMSKQVLNTQEICWEGNHNPTGSSELRSRTTSLATGDLPTDLNLAAQGSNLSIWQQLKLPQISNHPPQPLKDLNDSSHDGVSFQSMMRSEFATPENAPPVVIPSPPCFIVGIGSC